MKGFHGQIKDLVAQRQILAARIKKHLAKGVIKEAQELMVEFRQLETRSHMAERLDKAQRQQLQSQNKYVQGRIESLYGDTKSMLAKYLRPELASELMGAISNAEKNGGTLPAAVTTPTSGDETAATGPPAS